jgi:hypothetical protein
MLGDAIESAPAARWTSSRFGEPWCNQIFESSIEHR